MAETKRKFYNTGEAKGFSKKIFFESVLELATSGEVEQKIVDLIAEAARYELEGIELKSGTKVTGEQKNPLDSEYVNALRDAILPLVDYEPKTAKELIDLATAKGCLSIKGTPFAPPWTSRTLNALSEDGVIVKVSKVVEKTSTKGLKSQTEVAAYKKA